MLRAIRDTLGITQEQLAERLGVSFATVNRWENEQNAPQRAAREAIKALAAEAGIDVDEDAPSPVVASPGRRGPRVAGQAPSTKSMEQMLWDAAC